MKTFLEIEIDLRIAENITNVKSIRKRRSKKESIYNVSKNGQGLILLTWN